MAETETKSKEPKDIFLKPLLMTAKTIALFFDVATLMARLLFNTLFYDSHHGKPEVAEARDGRARD